MIDNAYIAADPLDGERLVVVGGRQTGGSLAEQLQDKYPEWRVSTADTYLSGIVEVSRHRPRAVLAVVDQALPQIDNAIAGLRQAAAPSTKLILCCTPEAEPIARRATGADDYLLLPLDPDECDAAIGYSRPDVVALQAAGLTPTATMTELVLLGELLPRLASTPMGLLEKLAELIQKALCARGAVVAVEGAVATSGDIVKKPVLSAPLLKDTGAIGQISVGERLEGGYSPADAEKLSTYAAVASNMLQAATEHRRWRRLAVTDECSGLPNRRYVHLRLDAILAQARVEHFPVTLLLFDVDDFKRYNDTFGHEAGDEILRVVGDLFRRHCREQDIVSRYGGDEFAVVFWDRQGPRTVGSAHPDCALAVLGRFTEALQRYRFTTAGPTPKAELTISGGLATFPWDASTREALFRRADEALRSAKQAGKNQVFVIGEHA